MGLDGGTYVTRTDVLRRQSWAFSQADNTHSRRGGAASDSTVYRPRQLDQQTERCADVRCQQVLYSLCGKGSAE
jgi:hypothetical protein